MFRLQFNPLYNEPDGNSAGGPIENNASLTTDDVVKILEADSSEEDGEKVEIPDPEIEKDDSGEEKPKEDKEEDELKPFEEEEPNEEKLKPSQIHATRREILKEFPEVFKKFPSLERAYFRDARFTELFPDVKDAEKAANDTRTIDQLDTELRDGNVERIIRSVKTNPDAFHSLVDNYLPTLQKIDGEAYNHVMGNVVKNVIYALSQAGREGRDETLSAAALVINRYFFNSTQWEPPTNLAKEKPPVSQEEEAWRQEQRAQKLQGYENARNELSGRLENTLRASLMDAIDPNQSMSDYVRRNAVRDAMDSVHEQMAADPRFKSLLNTLWRKASAEGYSKNSMNEIKSAFLARAKPLLSPAMLKARKEALKGLPRKDTNDNLDDDAKPVKRAPAPVGKSTARVSESGNNAKSSKTSIPKGMSTLDFLNS